MRNWKVLGLSALYVLVVTFFAIAAFARSNTAPQIPLYLDSGQRLGEAFSYGVTLGDVDKDDDIDAFVANTGANTLYLNDGHGGFSDSGQILGASASEDVALGDLDGDNDLDAFIANRGSFGGAADRVWLNNGSGNFNITDQNIGELSSSAVALGDVDGDMDLDAFVAACGPGFVSTDSNKLWLNDGHATFTDSETDFGAMCSSAVVMGRVDDNESLDIVVGNAGSSSGIEIWLNNGTGMFAITQVLDRGYNFGVDLGDLDGDGELDLFVANGGALGAVNPNTVWINDGNGAFVDSGQRLGSYASNAVVLSDVDLDGDIDAFVANGSVGVGQPNKVWLNDGAGNFVDSGENLGLVESEAVALADMDGDLDSDAFVANASAGESSSNTVWLNTTSQTAFTTYLPAVMR